MLALILLAPLVACEVSTLVQVICEPATIPQWPLAQSPLSATSLELLAALSQHTKAAYSPLLDQEHILPHSRFTACSSAACAEGMKAYTAGLFEGREVEWSVNRTMLEAEAACPRISYLLERDNVAATAHLEVIDQLKPFQTEIQSILGLNASSLPSLLGFAQYVALGGHHPRLSEAAHQWFATFHAHYSGNLMVGTFDQGKMLTFELLSDILAQLEAWTPLSVYIAPKTTYIALLKILTVFSGQANWGDSLTLAISRAQNTETTITFYSSERPLENDYCGNPCELGAFIEKMRGKRMLGSWGQYRKACDYLGDEDLSWKKYYLMVGVMVGVVVMLKGSDWIVKKAAPKPKQN